jgi:hypothetical protein
MGDFFKLVLVLCAAIFVYIILGSLLLLVVQFIFMYLIPAALVIGIIYLIINAFR